MSNNNNFRFSFKSKVQIVQSGEEGIVTARAEFCNGESEYLVRYKAADGRAVEQWWKDSALVEISSNNNEIKMKFTADASQLVKTVNSLGCEFEKLTKAFVSFGKI